MRKINMPIDINVNGKVVICNGTDIFKLRIL